VEKKTSRSSFSALVPHSTRNTWVLVDELDVHLHVRWQHKALNLMKIQVREQPGTTVIATTHSIEILEAFPIDICEEGLVKGGWIIEQDLR
jgi:predicted ATP-dependent endonuclease of OLD family